MITYIHLQYYTTKIGELALGSYKNTLCLLDFRYRKVRTACDARIKKLLDADFVEADDDVLQKARAQIDEYLAGTRKAFTIPVVLAGTDFQKSIWSAVQAIPYGNTATYLAIARAISNENSVRAVANAVGANPLALIVPCHRVVGSGGKLGGYAGGLFAKRWLLALEGAQGVRM